MMPGSQYGISVGRQPRTQRDSQSTLTATRSERQAKPHSDPAAAQVSPLFVEDRKGDHQNLTYGSLDKHVISRYQRAGRGRLLGVDSHYHITSRPGAIVVLEDITLDSTRKHPKATLLSNSAGHNQAVISIRGGTGNEDELHEDFMKFDHVRSRKRRRLSADPLQDTAEEGASDHSTSDSDEAPNANNSFDEFKNDPVQQEHLKLRKATEERPDVVRTWLDLIEFHRVNADNHLGEPSSGSINERNIAVYELALSKVKAQKDRQPLILGLMREGRRLWDVDKQASRWQAFLNRDGSFELWKLYINFVQTNFASFSYDDCQQAYASWIQTFKTSRPEVPTFQRDLSCIYVFLRLTLFLWQSGFVERAVGMWQALLELNCCRLPTWSLDDSIPAFRDFWETESARIGEEGAEGWTSGTNGRPDCKADKSFVTEHMDVQQWMAAEMELERTACLPARLGDEVSENDLHRIVLSQDIERFLFQTDSEAGCSYLVDAFLLFAGLPTFRSREETRQWASDPFICARSPLGLKLSQGDDRVHQGFEISVRFREVVRAVKVSQETGSLSSSSARLLHLHLESVRRIIHWLAKISVKWPPLADMMEYAVAFEAGIDLAGARKLAKVFLKQQGDRLGLWDEYASLQVELGNLEAAEKVWCTALSQTMSLDQDGQLHAFDLWRSWAYVYMCQGSIDKARTLISTMADADIDIVRLKPHSSIHPIPAAVQLKVERYLKAKIDGVSSSQGQTDSLPAIVDVLVLHKYLSGGLRLGTALETYQDCLEKLVGFSSVIEVIHEQRARFVYAHTATFCKEFRPKELIVVLLESVRRFPDNLDLLILHHHFLRKAGLIDRLHQVEAKADERKDKNRQDSVIPCMFDVSVELDRPAYSGSTNHSNRSAFRRATELGSPGHDSVEIWKAFVLWELSLDVPEGRSSLAADGKAKYYTTVVEVFHASLRACPWSKALCMLAFQQPVLRSALGDEGLKEVCQMMLDRGIRLRIDLSETLL